VGLASAGHFGLMAGSAHRLSPWPALEQRSQFLRVQKLTSKVFLLMPCHDALRWSSVSDVLDDLWDWPQLSWYTVAGVP
jgi:hypothetical protein